MTNPELGEFGNIELEGWVPDQRREPPTPKTIAEALTKLGVIPCDIDGVPLNIERGQE
jgi:hypothetical protein